MFKYITSARYPGNWRGTMYAFVIHWKEQVAQYEKLELENVPPKQKLHMHQNTVGDVSDLANVKQLSDQVVARGGSLLEFEGYMELLLSACSTYDKLHNNARQSGQRNVYASNVDYNQDASYKDHTMEVFHVDTDLADIMAYSTDTRYPSSRTDSSTSGASPFLPREEWLKYLLKRKKKFWQSAAKKEVI